MDYIEWYQDGSDEWRWKRVAPNGEVVAASSEGYTRYSAALENAVRVNGHLTPDGDEPDKAWVA